MDREWSSFSFINLYFLTWCLVLRAELRKSGLRETVNYREVIRKKVRFLFIPGENHGQPCKERFSEAV